MSDTDTFLKSSFGWLELKSYSADPTDTESLRRGLCFVDTVLKKWNGTNWVAITGGGGTSSWDELYDNDKTLTIDNTTLTYAVTADVDGLTITGSATVDSGALLQFTSGGDAKDIQGTSDSWSITKAGILACTGVTMGDSESIVFGDGSDASIDWDNATSLLDVAGDVNFEGAVNFTDDLTVAASKSLTLTGAAGTDYLILTAGDFLMSEGSITLTDDDNAASLSVTNDGATTVGNAADAGVVNLTCDTLTSGTLLNLSVTEGTLSGGNYIKCWDETAGSAVFTVGESGLVSIAGDAAGTDVLVISAGDILLDDSDSNIIESENGVLDLLLLDNKLGAVGAGKAVLKVDAGGVVNAAGYGIYASFTGAAAAGSTVVGVVPIAGSLGVKINAGGLATREALWIDADPTAYDVALIHSDAVIAADKALLSLTSAGAIAAGGNVLRVDVTGTPGAGAVYTEFDFAGITDTNENVGVLIDATSKKVQALKINAAPLAGSAILATSTGVLAADKATAEFVSNVSACNADSAVVRIEQSHTTGVATCMAIKQADVDKPFVTFEGTIGTNNSIQAVASLSLTGTHYIMIDIEGVGERYIEVGTLA